MCMVLTLSHLQKHFDAIAADDNIVAKGEIAHDEQFHLWPQCFQFYLTIKLSFMEFFQVFVTMFSKVSAADDNLSKELSINKRIIVK